MQKHTPGPWNVGYVGSIAKAFGGGIFDSGRNQIALATVLRDGSDETRKANARLIAAAPELLAACQFLMSQVETLAQHAFSEGVAEWLENNDAMNCGKRTQSQKQKGRPINDTTTPTNQWQERHTSRRTSVDPGSRQSLLQTANSRRHATGFETSDPERVQGSKPG